MPDSLREFVENRPVPYWQFFNRRIILQSQVWKGHAWRHEILIAEPPQGRSGDGAILEITGDNVADEDLVWANSLARMTGLPVFVLCQVPVQPLWDMREDVLIAHTFEQYLDSGDSSWPLLLPMTLAAASALDAIQEWSAGALSRFIVTGASKRGWTSWHMGAIGDERVIGIAPRLFDNLHFLRQINRQRRYWNAFSEEIDPYVNRDLPARFQTPEGMELLRMVDPWYSLDSIRVPVLLFHGAVDPFWMVDALTEYWDDIAVPKWCLVSPSRGHELWPIHEWGPTFAAFADACQRGGGLPLPSWDCRQLPDNAYEFSVKPMEQLDHWRLDALGSIGPRRFTKESVSLPAHFNTAAQTISITPRPVCEIAVVPTFHLEWWGREFPVSLPPVVIDRLES